MDTGPIYRRAKRTHYDIPRTATNDTKHFLHLLWSLEASGANLGVDRDANRSG